MKKLYFNLLLTALAIGIVIHLFGAMNTMANVKYELENSTDCISPVTGVDLCYALVKHKSLTAIFAVTTLVMVLFRKKIIKK
jgi:high-affinity nickel permease